MQLRMPLPVKQLRRLVLFPGPAAVLRPVMLHLSRSGYYTLQVRAQGPPEKDAAPNGAGDHVNGAAVLNRIVSPFSAGQSSAQLACGPAHQLRMYSAGLDALLG